MAENGVTTVSLDEAKATYHTAQAKVNQLAARQRELESEIDTASDEVRTGSIPGSVRLNQLAIEKGETDTALKLAAKELQTAKANLEHEQEHRRAGEFKDLASREEVLRAELIDMVRACSLLLGEHHDVVVRMQELRSQVHRMVGGMYLGPHPHENLRVAEAEKPIDAYKVWDGSVKYIPVEVGRGQLTIKPVRKF